MVYPAFPPGFQNDIAKLLDLGLSKIAAGRPGSGQVIADEGGGRATVLLGGRQFSLNLGQVTVGQSFTAQLEGGRLIIHLGSQRASVPIESLIGQSVPRPLASILANLGAPTGPVAQAVAHAFLAAGMPLSAEAIRTIAMILPQLSAGDVAALAFLFSHGLPISAGTLQTVQRTLNNRTKVGERLGEIDRSLEKLERRLDAIQDRVVAIQRRDELAERRQNLRREFVQWQGQGEDSEENKEKLAQDIQRSVKGQSTSAEAVRFSGASGAHLALSLYDLYLYLQQIQQMDILGSEIPFSLLLNQVNEAYEALAGQHLHNLPSGDPDRPVIYFFQIPIILEGEERTLEILYRQHSHHPEEGGTLTLRMELSQLGPIKIAFDLREGMLSVTITVTRADLKESIEPELESLREALSRAGFRVASVGVVHGVVPSTLREEAPETAIPKRPPKGLDLRV